MTNSAQAQYRELVNQGIKMAPPKLKSIGEQILEDNARARAYYEARGMTHYELHSNSIADSIAISRAHWPHLRETPAKLRQGPTTGMVVWG